MNLPVTDSVWAPKLTPALSSVPSSASPAGRRHARAGDDIIGFFPLVFPGVSMKKNMDVSMDWCKEQINRKPWLLPLNMGVFLQQKSPEPIH